MASLEEHARQLLALADDAPEAEARQFAETLQSWGVKAHAILGPTVSGQLINAQLEQTFVACEQLVKSIMVLKEAAREHANRYLGGN